MFHLVFLAKLHPCENNRPDRVSNHRQYFNVLNIDGFDFANGFFCSDVHIFEKLNELSTKIFELSFYQDQNYWKHKLIPIDFSKIKSDTAFELKIYKNLFVLIKKVHVLLGNHVCNFVCRRGLNSYVLMKHKQSYNEHKITSIRSSKESHIY